jgi:hypothetical protein
MVRGLYAVENAAGPFLGAACEGYNSGMPSERDALRTTLDLFDAGVDLMRQNLRREYPQANEDEIDRRLRRWLHERPGAESGDSPGRPVDLSSTLG